jgi:hypothetical protein
VAAVFASFVAAAAVMVSDKSLKMVVATSSCGCGVVPMCDDEEVTVVPHSHFCDQEGLTLTLKFLEVASNSDENSEEIAKELHCHCYFDEETRHR